MRKPRVERGNIFLDRTPPIRMFGNGINSRSYFKHVQLHPHIVIMPIKISTPFFLLLLMVYYATAQLEECEWKSWYCLHSYP